MLAYLYQLEPAPDFIEKLQASEADTGLTLVGGL